jgi:hypothetical protein
MPDRIQSYKVICGGGLNSNENHLDLSANRPGSATRLVNYEPSLFGGYRRINGYAKYDPLFPEVDDGNAVAEGKVLCVAYYKNEHIGNPYIIAARKDVGANTYSFWYHTSLIGWRKMTPGFTLNTTDGVRTVDRIRFAQFDFGSGSQIIFVDGVNKASVFNGTNWYSIDSTAAGGPSAAGGDQALDAPSVVDVFENHIFLSGDRTSQSTVAHSAPNDPLTFTVAAGAGQQVMGYKVVQIKPFRDNLFVFGNNSIKKVIPNLTAGFVQEQVTANVGCVAPDSVLEIGGDLLFLAPDGLRPVAGTSRIGDVELETVSKSIQSAIVDIIKNTDLSTLSGVVVRSKSQVRYFFGDSTTDVQDSEGIVGGLTDVTGSLNWEFGGLLGIRASCCSSEFIGTEEFVLHGDYDGRVYRQEQGKDFDGLDIVAIYATPYYDLNESEVRKTIRKVNTFLRAEGPFEMNLAVAYDWGDYATARPSSYTVESQGGPTVYAGRSISYSGPNVIYGGTSKPIMTYDTQGSGFSVRATYVTVGQFDPYTIQGIVFEYSVAGRR